jgi:hypothetical protein
MQEYIQRIIINIFFRRVENDLQPLEQSKLEITGKNYHIERLFKDFLLIQKKTFFVQ